MDNHEVVKIGDLEKNSEAIKVVGPNFDKETFPDAVQEGVDELTLRRGEEGVLRSIINTTSGDREGPPLADEDWHASLPIYKGVEGAAWELYCKFAEMNKAVCVRHRATMWKGRDAKERGHTYYDQTSEQHIFIRDAVRHELWDVHLQNPTVALDGALRRLAVWSDADSSTSEPERLFLCQFFVCPVSRAVFLVHLICASLDVFNVFTVRCDCCSVALSPIKDGLQQGEGWETCTGITQMVRTG